MMKLYSIRAYYNKDDIDPDRTFIITADSDEEAEQILKDTAYATEHAKFEIAVGEPQTTAPGPQFWGWTSGARVLKRG